MRVFAAVWPPDDVLDHLDLALGAVRRTLPGDGTGPVRWSARETWHLTCAFYGDVPDGRVPELAGALAAAAAGRSPYALRLRGAGVFAHRTLWVGVGGDTGAQQAVARAAVDAGASVGTRPDDRPRERAHLTIGRVRDGANGRVRDGANGRGARFGDGRGSSGWASRSGDLATGGRAGGAGARPGAMRADRRNGGRPDASGGASFDADALVGALAVYEGPEWTVDALRLVASRPGEGRGGGPLYTVVDEFQLGG